MAQRQVMMDLSSSLYLQSRFLAYTDIRAQRICASFLKSHLYSVIRRVCLWDVDSTLYFSMATTENGKFIYYMLATDYARRIILLNNSCEFIVAQFTSWYCRHFNRGEYFASIRKRFHWDRWCCYKHFLSRHYTTTPAHFSIAFDDMIGEGDDEK